MSEQLSYRPRAGEIPTDPGVYRFSDAQGRVLYVGKAKNLRQRLSNYFAPLRSLHERTRRMVTTATGVEWTVVGSDIEALQLEYTWIKEFDPPFNVKFRDDKTYPYLAVTLADEAPRVLVTRDRKIPGARYFGPYPKIWAVNETIDQLIRVFPIRTCNPGNYKRAMQSGRPCLPGQIGRCGGPCSGRVTVAEHRAIVNDFVAFLAGGDRRFITAERDAMMNAAAAQDYEAAAGHRDHLLALEAVMEKSAVVLSERLDADLYAIAHDELSAAVQGFIVRGGRIRGVRSWTVDKELELELPELVDSTLQRVYEGATGEEIPREIMLPALPEDAAEWEVLLSARRGGRVTLHQPQRGEKAALMETAVLNARQALQLYKTRRSADFVARSSAMTEIQLALGMSEAPLRMECYDVSHLGGTNIVASMVVFEDGLPRKDQYRRFSIAESRDDTDSMAQVLRRRLAYLSTPDADPIEIPVGLVPVDPDSMVGPESTVGPEATTDTAIGAANAEHSSHADASVSAADPEEPPVAPQPAKRRFAYPPQLLIVDGGQPQVQAAWEMLREAGRTDITLCGIAKRLEELWLPNEDYPVILPRGSEALFLLQRIRDEAHRFAIVYQRQRRKKDIQSTLADIPGLGPTRIAALLKHFGSVKALRGATAEEIARVPGVGSATAQAVQRHLAR